MRAAIYARYSSDQQSDASIEDQVRICQERASKEGWLVTGVYTDHAISGASLIRPGIQSLMRDGNEGNFDVVIAEAMDRLSRDQEDIAGFYKRMQFASVRIITLSEGEISNMHIGLKGTMNAMFLKDLADKTRRGLRGRVENGKSGGGITYGYDIVKRVDPNGNYAKGERAINEAEAAVVRRIFSEYIKGISPRSIAISLNAEGIPGPSGGTWGPSTIYGNRKRGTGIINNELYVGRMIWNRLKYLKDPYTGKRVSRLNSEADLIIHEVPQLRIVDQEVWDTLKQSQFEMPTGGPINATVRPKHLLTGMMKCGACGGGMHSFGRGRVGCANYSNKGTCGNDRRIDIDEVEKAVLAALEEHLMDEELCKEFCKEYTRRMNELRAAHNAALNGQRAELAKLERERQQIIKAIADGVDATLIRDRANYVQKRRVELEAIIGSAKDEPVVFHPQMSTRYQKAIAELISSFSDESSRVQASKILRSLIDKVVLTPRVGGEGMSIDLIGDLAGVLWIATNRDRNAISADLSKLQPVKTDAQDWNAGEEEELQISAGSTLHAKLVAGAGFSHSNDFQNSANPEMRGALISQGPNTGLANAMLVAGAGFEPATFRL